MPEYVVPYIVCAIWHILLYHSMLGQSMPYHSMPYYSMPYMYHITCMACRPSQCLYSRSTQPDTFVWGWSNRTSIWSGGCKYTPGHAGCYHVHPQVPSISATPLWCHPLSPVMLSTETNHNQMYPTNISLYISLHKPNIFQPVANFLWKWYTFYH